jgi:uncharacterized protein YgiM (DUF1202 family)
MLFNLRRFNRFLAVIAIGFVFLLNTGSSPAFAAPPAGPPPGPVGYVWAGQLNIRSGPDLNYNVVAQVYRNDTLGLTGRTTDAAWLRVRLPLTGQEGWAAARFIQIGSGSIYDLPVVDGGTLPPPPGQATVYVTVYQLNVRGGPGLTYNIIGTVRQGDSLPLIGRSADGAWLQAQVSSPYPTFAVPTGWVIARYVWSSVPIFQLPVTDGGTPPPPGNLTGIVTVPTLNVRSGPGLTYNISGQLNGGQQVKLLGRNSATDWLKVEWGGLPGMGMPTYTGWVMARYIRSSTPIYNLPVLGDQPSARRIQFAPGSSGATLWSSLPPNGLDTYVLTAQAGQTMTVNVIPASGQALFSISGANGEVLKSAGAGSMSWSGVLPLAQDYFIAASSADGSALDYTLQVTIPPR